MGRTLVFAVLASSPLVLGAYLGSRFTFPQRLLAGVLAFAAGALITALTFELFEQSFEKGGAVRATVGLVAGAVVFTAASVLLDRYVAQEDDPDGSAVLDKDAAAGERSPPAQGGGVRRGADDLGDDVPDARAHDLLRRDGRRCVRPSARRGRSATRAR